jgi:ATP-dependent Clp protease ATP-binding subunit ClpC
MFERLTEQARLVIVLGQEEARTLRHNYIGTEHLLLGLLREEKGLAAAVLDEAAVTLERVRGEVARVVGTGIEATGGQIPFTPRAKRVLELSVREARARGHQYVGTEHLLLGVLTEGEGVAIRVLGDLGVDPDDLHQKLQGRMLPGTAQPVDEEAQRRRRLEAVEARLAAAREEVARLEAERGALRRELGDQ